MQLEFLKLLYKPGDYSSLLFVADTAQSIYPHSWLVRGRSFTSLGLDLTGQGQCAEQELPDHHPDSPSRLQPH
ncbi:MAG: hypothetical protein ACOX2G_07855 [Bacillota bacterium]